VNGGYSVISGPTTGAAISLGTNSATFDRNLSLGLVGGDLVFAPILTINAQTGNVGIGICTPDRRLYVTDTSVSQGTFLAYNQCTTFCGTVIEGITDRTSSCTFNLMNLKSSTTSMFIVRGDGNVGIGTSTPSRRLIISGGTTNAGLEILSANGHRTAIIAGRGSSGTALDQGYFQMTDQGTAKVALDTDGNSYLLGGNFGIGTTTPTPTSGKGLHIYSNCGHANLALESSTSGVKWEILSTMSCNFVVYQAGGGDRFTIAPNGITTFACRVCISVGRTNGADSTALNLHDKVTGIQTPGFGLRLVYQSNGTGVQSAIGLENGGTGTNNESQISFYTQNTAGGLGKRLLLTSGGDAGFGGSICAGSINSYNGIMSSNGVITYSIGGTMVGTTAAYYDFPTWNDGGQGQMFEIKAFFDHFYNWAYGAHYYGYLTTREGNSQALTMFNCTTGNGGGWMAYKSSTTNLRVCKLAGTYPGGGAYWIQVTAKQA
jgi:hypothetical protein